MAYKRWIVGLVVGLFVGSCTSGGGGGSQTNWVKCQSSAECAAHEVCVQKHCQSDVGTSDGGPAIRTDARPPARLDSGPSAPDAPSPTADAPYDPLTRSSLARATTSNDTSAIDDAVAGNTRFALEMYAALRDSNDGNVIFSPFSISMAMAMAWGGAKGTTADEIASVFHFTSTTHLAMNALEQKLAATDERLVTQFANALWILPDIAPRPAYLDLLATDYGAGVGLVDFGDAAAAADLIDRWVSDRTRGTIPRLLEPGDLADQTKCVITNAVYFKAEWLNQFAMVATHDASFEVAPGNSKQVRMMDAVIPVPYAATAAYEAAAVPYRARGGHAYEAVFVLPHDMKAFEQSLGADALSALLSNLHSQNIELLLPKFSTRSALSLSTSLSNLGMPTAFKFGADFSGVSTPPPGFIHDVIHQGFLSIDENGTEASAATAIIIVDGGVVLDPPVLTLDRPFLVFIRDTQTGTVLFMARIVDPTV